MKLPLSEPCKISYRWFSFSADFLLNMSLQVCLNVKNGIRFLLTLVTDNVHLRIGVSLPFNESSQQCDLKQFCDILFKHYVSFFNGIPTDLPFEGIFDFPS